MFDAGFSIAPDFRTMAFVYGEDAFGPVTEKRFLNDIRASLRDPDCIGPDLLYSVAMDVGKRQHLRDLQSRNLLYGAMIYAGGRLGQEPVRSQGHAHAVSASCGTSTPEVYEIWDGSAAIYMQERNEDDAGDCFVVYASSGDVIIVPEGWVHCTINASDSQEMTFGAWCVRDYGFDYTGVRAHGGVAFFPYFGAAGQLLWKKNPRYTHAKLHHMWTPDYSSLDIAKGIPIYTQYENNPGLFDFVTHPAQFPEKTKQYLPNGGQLK